MSPTIRFVSARSMRSSTSSLSSKIAIRTSYGVELTMISLCIEFHSVPLRLRHGLLDAAATEHALPHCPMRSGVPQHARPCTPGALEGLRSVPTRACQKRSRGSDLTIDLTHGKQKGNQKQGRWVRAAGRVRRACDGALGAQVAVAVF